MLTVVLLPGMDGTGALFEPIAAELAQAFRVQVIDYPTSGALGYAHLEQYVRKHLPTSDRYVLLGESFSGPIAVSIAASRPSGLVGLVLCSSFVRNPRPGFGWLRHIVGAAPVKLAPLSALSALLLGRFSTPALRSSLATAMSRVSSEALRSRLRAVLSIDVSARLEEVAVPSLYLLAAHDRVVPISSLEHIQARLAQLQVATIDAPHFLLQATPGAAARAITEFLRSIR